MKKYLSLLLMMLMLLSSFVGCADTDAPPAGESTTTVPTDAETTTGDDEPITNEPVAIAMAELANYNVIRAERAGDKVLEATSKLVKAVDQIYSVKVTPKDDFFREDIPAYGKGELEILIGATNREESVEFLSTLKQNDYGYRLIGKKLVIAGHTDENTAAAVDEFIVECMSSKGEGDIFFSNEKSYVRRGEYMLATLSLCGVAVNKYRIVYPYRATNSEDIAAEKIKNTVAELSGFVLEAADDRDAAGEYEIMVGNVAHLSDALKSGLPEIKNNDYYIAREGNKIWISAATTAGYIGAAKELCSGMYPESGETSLDCAVKTGLIENVGSDLLTTMSFNVWVSSKTDERSKAVVDMILKYMPDTVGVQEASPAWMSTLKSGLGSLYDCVGVGRNGGNKGEYSAVFYLKDKFTLKESGTKWLSATPDVANTKFASSSLPRIMTYALLERKSDGQVFAHVNTHLEHTSSQARDEQIAVLLKEIEPLMKYPIVMTGDFNAKSDTDVYKDVIATGFADSAKVAETAENEATFPSSNKIIDFIFVTKTNIIVESYEVCEEYINGVQPSDHRPIVSKYIIVD